MEEPKYESEFFTSSLVFLSEKPIGIANLAKNDFF